MGKVSRAITFDKNFLNKLLADSNAGVKILRQIYHLALHPFQLTDVDISIKDILNNLIAKYDKKFNGILLGCHNIKLLEDVCSINFDNSYLHLNMEADFYIFNPEIGKALSGIVNKKSKDHVGCLVHNTFNVSLPRRENSENWLGNSIQLGQEVQFEIIYTDFNGRLPYIRGKILSIASDDSGFSTSEEQTPSTSKQNIKKNNDSDSEAEINIKKERKHKTDREIIESETEKRNIYSEAETVVCFETKRKRKHKSSPHTSEINQEESDGEEFSKIHKKHKKKKHKEKPDYSQISEEIPDRSLTNESFTKKRKKHKKSTQEIEVSESNEHQKKTKKHKQPGGTLKLFTLEYSNEVNEDYEDSVQVLTSNVEASASDDIPRKKKKKKHKHEDELPGIDIEIETEEKLCMKKKKKKKHSVD